MNIIIQSLGFKASEHLEEFVREKLAKLVNQHNVIRANVTLFQDSDSSVEKNHCEIRLAITGNDLFVKKHDKVFEKAITEAVDTLKDMVLNQKKKELHNRKTSIQDKLA